MITGRCECGSVQYQVDGDPELPPGYHIFVGSKAPWDQFKDQLVRYDTLPDE
jgi:hypothetical protein